jgi:hypothetical protein
MTKIPRICVIVFHSNLLQYPKQWILDFSESILNQTYSDFDILEINYSGGEERIFASSIYESIKLNNHAEAMNYLIDKAFASGYDYVLNSNCDDTYALDRIEKQLPYLLEGYDIVSSNFSLFNDKGVFHTHRFDKLNIRHELERNHNVICHPVIAMSKHFWSYNRYKPEQIPTEDMKLWQRTIRSFRFIILKDVLLFHREHEGGVGRS